MAESSKFTRREVIAGVTTALLPPVAGAASSVTMWPWWRAEVLSVLRICLDFQRRVSAELYRDLKSGPLRVGCLLVASDSRPSPSATIALKTAIAQKGCPWLTPVQL
jgi:hypothetical protein